MKKAIITLDEQGALTLPPHLLKALHLEAGDEIEVLLKDGYLIIQATEWQLGEQEADQNIAEGNVRRFSSLQEALHFLHG